MTEKTSCYTPPPTNPPYLPPSPHVPQRTTGAFHTILQRNSFDDAVLVAQRSAVVAGTITEDDLKTILFAFRPLIPDVEARSKAVRSTPPPLRLAQLPAACLLFPARNR